LLKPNYKVPAMAEIAEMPPNGYKVVSTFSGCGGTCLGFRMAGFQTVWASEFIPAAQQVYRLNHPHVPLNTKDIRDVLPEDILRESGLSRGEVDVFEGSPPCASFSSAGRREALWGQIKKYSDTKQRTDDLFWEYARIIEGVQPKVFIGENVEGLIRGRAKGYFKQIFARLKETGYKVNAQVLDAQWLGVPQFRRRVIFMGVREDLDLPPVYPKPFSYQYTFRDAIQGITNHGFTKGISSSYKAQLPRMKIGKSNDKYMNMRRLSFDKPSPTILAEAGRAAPYLHPNNERRLSIPEVLRIQSFPDDFKLSGVYDKDWERLGRSVPPLMARAIAQTIREDILEKC